MVQAKFRSPEDFSSVPEFLRETTGLFDARPFLKLDDLGLELSFGQIKELWERGAAFLQAAGVGQRDRVILSLGNSCEFILALGAMLLAGAVPILINPDTAADQFMDLAELCGAKRMVGNSHVPGIKRFSPEEFSPPRLERVTSDYHSVIPQKDDLAYIIFTSGTSGKMKGTLISQGNVLVELGSLIRAYRLTSEDAHLCVLPLYHASALFRNFLIPLALGARMVLEKEFTIPRFWKLIEAERIGFVQVVPTILSLLLESPMGSNLQAYESLKYLGTASAPCPLDLIRKFEKKFGIMVIEGYGLTETTCGATLNPPSERERQLGSVGKPIDIAEITVVDESGRPLPPNREGEIKISGPLVAAGYLTTEERAQGKLSKESIMTNDTGYLDEEGFLYISGRKTDLIYRAGFKVSPKEVEEQLVSHPDIEFAVVFGILNEFLGEDIIAYVKPVADIELAENEVRAFLKEKLVRYKIPTRIYEMPEMLNSLTFKASRDIFRDHYLKFKMSAFQAAAVPVKSVKLRAFLTGETVYLRPVMEKDRSSDRYLDNIMTGEFQRYTLAGRFPQSEASIRSYWDSVKTPDSLGFAICDLQTEEHVGNISLRLDWVARTAEFGRMIFREFQYNSSYSLDSMKLVMKYVFQDLKLRRLWGGGGNPSSIPSLLKLGFTYEGRMRQHGLLGGQWRDLFIMGILDHEYFAIKSGQPLKRLSERLYSPEVFKKVIEVVAQAFNVDGENLDPTSGPATIEDWDSLGMILLWSHLEEEFKVQLTADDMIWITTLGDLAIMLEGKLNA
jgi:acyl-CoA synthetase (AMP-forming)/AMP-acid ligase II/RimJ/RimL family protein N-acetyltransferase/acyl carrier protein